MINRQRYRMSRSERISKCSFRYGLLLALGCLLGALNPLNAQTLTWLGTMPGYDYSSFAFGVSADGAVVVGKAVDGLSGIEQAFRWTQATGMQSLGTLGGSRSSAFDVSADGYVVVGWADNVSNSRHAFRWTVGGGMQDLGTLGGPTSEAWGVSADGTVVVGWARSPLRAFRWTAGTGMQSLGTLGGSTSEARDVSENGTVVVGRSLNHLNETWAFWWKLPLGMQGLYPLAACCGEANGVSDNGLVIVGHSHSAQTERWHACMWWWDLSTFVTSDLGTLGGDESEALACTDNRIVVGWSHNSAGQRRAFRWTTESGMEDLSATYAYLLTQGSYLSYAYDISPNGRYLVGQGYNAQTGRDEAFLLDIICLVHNGDVDRNGCVDDADLLSVLFAFGQTGNALGRVDVNCDGVVDDSDLLEVLFNFGSGC